MSLLYKNNAPEASSLLGAFTSHELAMLRHWYEYGPTSAKSVGDWIELGTPIVGARGVEHMPAATFFKVYKPDNRFAKAEREQQLREEQQQAAFRERDKRIATRRHEVQQIAYGMPRQHAEAAMRLLERAGDDIQSINSVGERLNAVVASLHVPAFISLFSDAQQITLDSDYSDIQTFAIQMSEHFTRRAISFENMTLMLADRLPPEQRSALEAQRHAAFLADCQTVRRLTGWRNPAKADVEAFYLRIKDPSFWRRHIQKKLTLNSIQAARQLQMLGKGQGRSQYLPWDVVDRKHQQIELFQDWAKRTILHSSDGKQMTLADITADAAVKQLAELDIRCIAQYLKAKRNGYQAFLVTITCPSRFHAVGTRTRNDGTHYSVPNPRFNPELTPGDSIDWLQHGWARFRAEAQRICGPGGWDSFGATEGQTDATGHRHILIYCPPTLSTRMRDALLDSFLYSDNPNEPGALERRVRWEAIRSEDGAKKYITKILRYTTKTLENSDKPSAEAMCIKALGRRSFSMTHDHVGHWRWLRARKHPYGLPNELHPAWAAAHGLNTDDIPTPQEYEAEQLGKFKSGINGDTTRPEHYLAFLDSVAPAYKPAWREQDFFKVVDKTLSDFLVETADPVTGEVDHTAAWEAFYCAWCAAWEGDDSKIVKEKTRLTNKYGEPRKPSGGAHKAPFLYRIDAQNGELLLATRTVIKWVKETLPRDKAARINLKIH